MSFPFWEILVESQAFMNPNIQVSDLILDADAATPAAVAEHFWRDGIVVLEDFLDEAAALALREELASVVATEPNKSFSGGDDYVRHFDVRVQVWPGSEQPQTQKAMSDPRLDQYTRAICREDYAQGFIGIFSTPRGGMQGWHQDSSSPDAGDYEINRIIFPATAQPEQGALVVVPGTHRGGDLPVGGNHEPLPGEIAVSPRAGSLVLMHTRCFHRVAENQTDTPRTQVNSRARPASANDEPCNRAIFRTGIWHFPSASYAPREVAISG